MSDVVMHVVRCTHCLLLLEDADRPKEDGELGEPATIQRRGRLWYITPHKPTCLRFMLRMDDRRAGRG